MRSMTGFGLGEAAARGGRLIVEVRSVNQRFLDVRVRMPAELSHLALFVEQLAREKLRRGRVDVAVRADGFRAEGAGLDRERAAQVIRALAALRDEVAPGSDLPLSVLAAVPGVFTSAVVDEESLREALGAAVVAALRSMEQMLIREGQTLGVDMGARVARIADLLDTAKQRAADLPEIQRRRLLERLARLTRDANTALDASRLETEIAILADRCDVTEEVTRFDSHIAQFRGALDASDEPVGRKLDFLLQEMLREANTIAAKAQDARISELIVTLKVELERLREQVQNVE